MNRPLRSALASILSAAILVTAPGLPATRAVAAGFAAPRGAAAAPQLRTVVGGLNLGAYEGRTQSGVDLHGLFTALRAADLSTPEGLRLAAPLLARLPEGRAADEAAVVFAALSAATALEKTAVALAGEAPKAVGSGRGLPDLDARMAALDGLDAYLSAGTRTRFAGARMSVSDAVIALRAEAAGGLVRETTREWTRREPEAVAARESRPVSGLTRRGMVAVLEARQARVAAPVRAPAAKQSRAAWTIALGLTAAVGIGLASTSLGAATVLLIAGFLAGSVLAHEWAHLLVLNRLGDDTARLHGVSLNPLKQMDPWGTLLMPVLSVAASLPFFGLPVAVGWAKAVPVDFNKLPNPKLDAAKVALAGPAANLLLAGAAFAALALAPAGGALAIALAVAWKANLALAVFNLLPLPQLDGGKLAVALMPQALYERWTSSPNLPAGYQKSYTRLYEGPARLLTWLGLSDLGRTNRVTRLITMGVMGAFFVGATVFFKLPLLLLLLVCSYDYYCVREKIQNEEAVQDLIVILQDFAGELSKLAADDPLVKSEVDVEEAEHALKNALEDTIDKVVDSEGFEALSAADKWERLKAAYTAAAVDSLKAKTMAADDAATIRRLLESPQGQAYMEKVKGWVERWDVFNKWHSPKRKAKGRDSMRDAVKDAPKAIGSSKTTLGLIAVAALGASMAGDLGSGVALGLAAFGLGTLAAENKPKSFFETLDEPELKIAPKEKQFLSLMLTEMKQQDKPPVVGRLAELHEVVKTVTAPRGVINSVVLVGKAGTGKTAVVEKFAQALAQAGQEDGPATFGLSTMKGKFLVKLNLPRLLQQEQPAQALDALLSVLSRLNDADKRKGSRVVLFIDEVHQLFEHPQGALMANALKEPLRDGELTVVAATTETEYKKYMENDEAFRRRLIKVDVPESSTEESLRALRGAKSWYERLYGMTLPDETLQAAAELSKYDQEVFLPGRAFLYVTLAANNASFDAQRDRLGMAIADRIGDLRYEAGRLAQSLAGTPLVTQKLKEDEPGAIELYNRVVALTRELVELYAQRAAVPAEGVPTVSADMVKGEISRRTGVASGQLSLGREPMEKYLEMEDRLGRRVVGQDEAVASIAASVRQNKAGLSNPNRPMGTFYLTGPTGVGKTHLAKELARFLFDDPEAVTRLDMSEYMESHQVARLIGAPPGYVGYGQGGQLTEAVRKRPYGVLLLDEIEKAHSDVWLMLLQITGDGRLTDGEGRTVSFKNTIILMTSNLGMALVDTRPFEEEYKKLKTALEAAQDGPAREIVKAKMRELAARLGAATKQQAQTITEEAFRATYPPEFAGRLSAPPIVFNRIDPDMAAKIVDLNLAELRGVLGHAGHELTWSPAAVEALVLDGFSITLGARPLSNAIDRLITQPLAKEILKSYASGEAGPRAISVDAKDGKLSITLSPIAPKPVSKATVEGAAQELFSRVLGETLKAASSSMIPELALDVVDAWTREAVGALGGAVTKEAAADTPAPATKGLYAPDALPALPPAAASVKAEHNDAGRKDPAFAAGRKAAAAAVPSPEWADFIKVFGDQAKRMSPEGAAPVELAYGLGEASAVVAFTRRGELGAKEAALLKTHFGGPAPVDEAQARDKAEALNVMGQDGRRLMFDLHRALAAVPGARLGWKASEGTVTYWLELPVAATTPEPEPATPAAAAPTPAPLSPKLQFRSDLPVNELAVRLLSSVDPSGHWDTLVRRMSLPEAWLGAMRDGREVVVRAADAADAARLAALLSGDAMVEAVGASSAVERLLRAPAALPASLDFGAKVPPSQLVVHFSSRDARARWNNAVRRLRLPANWKGKMDENGIAVVDAANPKAAAKFALALAGGDDAQLVIVSHQVRDILRRERPAPPDEGPPGTAQAPPNDAPLLSADARIPTSHPKVSAWPHDYMAGPAAPEIVWFRLSPELAPDARRAAAAELAERAGLRLGSHAGPAHHHIALGQDGRSAMRGALVLAEDARVVEVAIDEPAVPLLAEVAVQPELPLSTTEERAPIWLASNFQQGTLMIALGGGALGDGEIVARLMSGGAARARLDRSQPNLFFVRYDDAETGAAAARALAGLPEVAQVTAPASLGALLPEAREALSNASPVAERMGKFDLTAGLTPGWLEIRFFPAQTVTVVNEMMSRFGVPDGAVRRRGNGLFLHLDVGDAVTARRVALAFSREARVSGVRVSAAHRDALARELPSDTPGIPRLTRLTRAGSTMSRSRLLAGSASVEDSARRELEVELQREGLSPDARAAVSIILDGVRGLMSADGRPEELGWGFDDDRVRVRFTGPVTERLGPALALATENALARALALINGRLYWRPGAADQGGVWLEMLPPRERVAAAAEPASPGLPEWRPGEGARGRAVQFARALLAQGDQRGPTLRMSAAETLAALSTPEDLAAAREWVAQREPHRRYPEIAAGALTIARHGRQRGDLDRLKGAAYRLSYPQYNGHAYNAVRARVAEAIARLLGRADERGRSRLPDLYREEDSKEALNGWMGQVAMDESSFGTKKSEVLLDAYYEAMARYGDEDATELLLEEWTQKRVALLYEHLARVAPQRLDALLTRGRALATRDRVPDGSDRLLFLLALAERGTVADARWLAGVVADGWRGTLDGQTKPLAGEALARAASRGPRSAAAILEAVRPWLRETLEDGSSFSRMSAAVQAVGAAGTEADLAALERIVRYDPADVSYEHEMTQHEAAMAWARLVVREGLARRFLTEPGPAVDGRPGLPRLLAMLADRSAIVNKAALEALKLLLSPREEARALPPETDAAPAVAAPLPATPRDSSRRLHARPSRAGSDETILYFADRAGIDSSGYEPVARLDAEARDLHWAFSRALGAALEALTGTPFTDLSLSIRSESESFTWVLRQSVTRTFVPAAVARAREYLSLLLYWTTLDEAAVRPQLRELERNVPGTTALLATLRRVVAVGGRLGLDHDPARANAPQRGELELWWTTAAPPPPVRR